MLGYVPLCNKLLMQCYYLELPTKEILWAAEKGKSLLVKQLLESDPTLVNAVDNDGYTPLHRACYNNDLELVDILLRHGADVAAKTEYEWQPLHCACHWNHFECAARLLQYGADVNAKSDGGNRLYNLMFCLLNCLYCTGQTPLHIAASHGSSYETVQLLLSHPYIQPLLLNKNNETAHDLAKRSSRFYKIFEMALPIVSGIE